MASLDEAELLSANELSDIQIRRRLTQEFNFNCGPVNNTTRKVLLKKLERLESKRNSFQDSVSSPATADDGEKEKENFIERINVSPPKLGKNLNEVFDQSFGKEDNEEQTSKQSPIAKLPQIYTTPKKSESPTKVKERKSVRINETFTNITTASNLSQYEEDNGHLLQSSDLSPTVSSNEYFKRPQCRPPIRRSTNSQSTYELDDSKTRRSPAISSVSALFTSPYFLVTIAVIIAFLVFFYMYLF